MIVKIEAAGGIGYIADAMHSHPTISELQCSACGALANMFTEDETRAKIESANIVELIIAAIHGHPTNRELQCNACGAALANLAWENAAHTVKIEAGGGIDCIAAAMRRHPTTASYKVKHIRLWQTFHGITMTIASRSRQQGASNASLQPCAAFPPTASY